MSTLASKLTSLQAKSTKLTFEEIKTPVNSLDLLQQFQKASGPSYDVSNEHIIDVMPDFSIPIAFITMMANRAATAAEYKVHAKASPPTFCLYYATVLYGYFLLSDCLVRPVPSVHAKIWKTESTRSDFVKFLHDLPVPEEMEFLLSQFAPSTTESSPNIFAIPSFAGYVHHQFFGKLFPLKFFVDLHNTVASTPGNSPYGTIYHNLFKRAIACSIANPKWSFSIADYYGMTIDQTNSVIQAPATKSFQIFESIFNPVLFRDFHRRSSLARIPLEVPEFPDVHYNAYDLAFAASDQNLPELKVVLTAVSAILKTVVPMKKTLSDILSSSSGINIFQHGYSDYRMPTSSYNSTMKLPNDMKAYSLDSVNLKTFAASINFLDATNKSSLPDSSTAVPAIKTNKIGALDDTTTTSEVTQGQLPFVTRPGRINTDGQQFPTSDRLIKFNIKDHVNPRVRVIDVHGTQTVTAYLATLSGKIIESFEFDGTTVPVPNLNVPLGVENSHFADSAFPVSLTVKRSIFDIDTTIGPRLPVERHLELDSQRHAASHLFLDRTKIYFPYLDRSLRDTTLPTMPGNYSGFTGCWTNWLAAVQSFFGLETIAPDAASTATDDLVQTPKNSRYLWSPYTITTKQRTSVLEPTSEHSRIYFLSNLTTFLGTDKNMIQVTGPFEAMPVS